MLNERELHYTVQMLIDDHLEYTDELPTKRAVEDWVAEHHQPTLLNLSDRACEYAFAQIERAVTKELRQRKEQ